MAPGRAPANSGSTEDFTYAYTDEPHASRRVAILKKYPEIKKLFGIDWRLKYITAGLVLSQVAAAWFVHTRSWLTLVIVAYVFGGVINHALELAIHELSHNLYFKKILHNRLYSMFANLPMVFASAITFKHYHMEHHTYQGCDNVDMDIPSRLELNYVRGPILKALWVASQGAWYALRPLFCRPKAVAPLELLNWVVCIAFDAAIIYFFGLKGITYLLLSDLFGLGLHPVAGHFIAEHYEFVPGTETYSYYGSLNWVNFFVGYHVEHHDFPFIPGTRLHRVREIAPEFYDNLPHHTSYVYVIWRYITDPTIGPWSRIKRSGGPDGEAASGSADSSTAAKDKSS